MFEYQVLRNFLYGFKLVPHVYVLLCRHKFDDLQGKATNKDSKCRSSYPPRPQINPITWSKHTQKTTSKVHQLVNAMNKTGFLQEKNNNLS